MDELRRIVTHQVREYGCVKIKLAAFMEEHHITRNRLKELTGTKYDVVDRYYKGENIERVDLDFLAKVCFVLNCSIGDILEYHPPGEEK